MFVHIKALELFISVCMVSQQSKKSVFSPSNQVNVLFRPAKTTEVNLISIDIPLKLVIKSVCLTKTG